MLRLVAPWVLFLPGILGGSNNQLYFLVQGLELGPATLWSIQYLKVRFGRFSMTVA